MTVNVICDLATAKSPRVGSLLRNEKIMISTLRKLQDKKTAQDVNGGFTLIELLIVIVVLGILAAVVVFSLGSVTGQSAVAACQADGATVETAMAAYNAQDTTGTTVTQTALVPTYITSFPSNPNHYKMEITGGKLYVAYPSTTATSPLNPAAAPVLADWNLWSGAGTCLQGTTVK